MNGEHPSTQHDGRPVCAACRFWVRWQTNPDKPAAGRHGDCRCHAPRVVEAQEVVHLGGAEMLALRHTTKWPSTHEAAIACGDFDGYTREGA